MAVLRTGAIALGIATAIFLTSTVAGASQSPAPAVDTSSACPFGQQKLTDAAGISGSDDAYFSEALHAAIAAFGSCLALKGITDAERGRTNISQAVARLALIRILVSRLRNVQSQGDAVTEVGRVGANLDGACPYLDQIPAVERDLVTNNIAPSYLVSAHELGVRVRIDFQAVCHPSLRALKQGIDFGN